MSAEARQDSVHVQAMSDSNYADSVNVNDVIHVLSIPTDSSLNLRNMQSALDTLPDTQWRQFGEQINVPDSKLSEIQFQFSTDGERKAAVFNVYLTEHPQPTWDHVSDVLYQLRRGQYHSVLDRLQSMFPTGECADVHVHCVHLRHVDSSETRAVCVHLCSGHTQ